METDPRFNLESGREVFTGNQLLLKGALETVGGVGLLTGHCGAPVAGFFDACHTAEPLLAQHRIKVRPAGHESLAIAQVHGAQLAGQRAMAVLNHVGLHAGTEALAAASNAGCRHDGGALIVVGDDTWADTTTSSDSRFFFEHLRIPLLEPAEPQEVKDWVALALRMAGTTRSYLGMRLSAEIAEGGGSVQLKSNYSVAQHDDDAATFNFEKDTPLLLPHFAIPPGGFASHEQTLNQRLAQVCAEARRLGVNHIQHRPHKGETAAIGFIASGAAFAALQHALEEMGLHGRLPILKLGLVWPVDQAMVQQFASQVSQVVVVEPGRAFIEPQVRAALIESDLDPTPTVWGKRFPRGLPGIPAGPMLHPSQLIERLVRLVRQHPTLPIEWTNGHLDRELHRIDSASESTLALPDRTPTFCAGCPQRDTTGVVTDLRRDLRDTAYMQRVHRRGPAELVVHGDVGCSSLMSLPPHDLFTQTRSGRGLGGAVAAATQPFIANKQVVFMGDGTFFHSGRLAVHQAISSKQDVTYIIVENQAAGFSGDQPAGQTAPTFHDETLRKGKNASRTDRIEQLVRGMSGPRRADRIRIIRINPEDREEFRGALEQAILADGVKIIIADKSCAITAARKKRRQQQDAEQINGKPKSPRQTHMRIVEEVCEHCLHCTSRTGCPGLDVVDTDYGPKIQTNPRTCDDDGACARLEVCPAFERVTVVRGADIQREDGARHDIPDPPRPRHADQDVWRCAVASVGGMGGNSATQALVFAGREMGYHIHFMMRKGAAIRTGPVFSQIIFTRDGQRSSSGHIPYGKADLLIGIDPLEAARAVAGSESYRVASPDMTCAVVNSQVTPTTRSLIDGRQLNGQALCDFVQHQTCPDGCFAANVETLARQHLGHGRYANVMLLGIAYQLGYLPLTLQSLERSIGRVFRKQAAINMRAFRLGRRIAHEPGLFDIRNRQAGAGAVVRRKHHQIIAHFGKRRGRALARKYVRLMRHARQLFRDAGIEPRLFHDYAIRTADCVIWRGGIDYARRYSRRILSTIEKDRDSRGHRATEAVIWNLAKVMLIKDEVYVAALLSSKDKRQRDRGFFDIRPERGDRLIYHRYLRPQITFFGLRHTFHWRSRDWQLRLVSRWRWLRLLPGWSRNDTRFREWYEKLVDRSAWQNANQYEKWVAALQAPSEVAGFRDLRWPGMDAARAAAEAALNAPEEAVGNQRSAPHVRVSLSDRILTSSHQ